MRQQVLKASEHLARSVYSALLLVYPAAFRRAYRDELVLLFVDMHRAASAHGVTAVLRLWLSVLLDLVVSASRERLRPMIAKVATAISLALCSPILCFIIGANLGYQPPFVDRLNAYMLMPDGYTPTLLGRFVMLGLLLALPLAFVINLLAMVATARSQQGSQFRLTPAHTITGLSILIGVLLGLSGQIRYELRPFVTPLGAGAAAGQTVFFLALLAVPVAFLFGRLPRFALLGAARGRAMQPTSINLIIGATILLVILVLLSSFALEATACAIGVPNCD